MYRYVLALFCVSISGTTFAADVLKISCLFEKFIKVEHDTSGEYVRASIHQSMRIVNGRTDDATIQLDGQKRATNSLNWKRLDIDNWETWETAFVGDFREVLTLAHDLGDNMRPLHSWYKASLISPNVEYTQILLGRCIVE
ncbi:hypothetical protein [Acinetobacter brisouii]|uniref:hypothetical protein n=1 Tax=Acinetobacter brisouii TaxID=396323 RepID=UPI000A820ACD|nr:hypothetical protein [Acinetobacter brisouii]